MDKEEREKIENDLDTKFHGLSMLFPGSELKYRPCGREVKEYIFSTIENILKRIEQEHLTKSK